jgi:hypothetical protein
LCGTDRTAVQKRRNGDYENWYRHGNDDGFICNKCYQKKKREPKENRFCSMCRSHNSKVNKRGAMIWYFLDDSGERVCYRCRLDSILRERQLKNQSRRCTSETCKQARENLNVAYDYTTKAYCSKCETQHPIDLARCPCCHYKMRKRPVHLSAKKNRKLLETDPLFYH